MAKAKVRLVEDGDELFVELNGQTFLATPAELVQMTLAVAEGKVTVEALTIWFRQRLRGTE